MFEDRCSLAPHNCAARVGGVALNVRDRVLQPPDYDGRNIVELVDKYVIVVGGRLTLKSGTIEQYL